MGLRITIALAAAESFAGLDDQAIAFVQKPLHSRRLPIARVDGLADAVAREIDPLARAHALIAGRPVERLDLDRIFLAVLRED